MCLEEKGEEHFKSYGRSHWAKKCNNCLKPHIKGPAVPRGSKWCRRCDTIKTLDEFGNNKKTKDKKSCYCKKCNSEASAKDAREKRKAWTPEQRRADSERRSKAYADRQKHAGKGMSLEETFAWISDMGNN